MRLVFSVLGHSRRTDVSASLTDQIAINHSLIQYRFDQTNLFEY